MINQAPHGIDLFLLLGGLPSGVTAKVRTRLHKIEVEDEACALLEYPNGAWGYYYTTTNEVPATTLMEISGDKGKLLYHNGSLKFYSFKSSIAEFTFSSKDMWASPEVVEEKPELPQEEYEELLESLKKTSREKKVKKIERITDPRILNKE